MLLRLARCALAAPSRTLARDLDRLGSIGSVADDRVRALDRDIAQRKTVDIYAKGIEIGGNKSACKSGNG